MQMLGLSSIIWVYFMIVREPIFKYTWEFIVHMYINIDCGDAQMEGILDPDTDVWW